MAAAQPSSPAPSSPDLEGYDSALEEVNTPRRRIGDGGESGGDSVSSDDSNQTIRTPPQRVLDWGQPGACEGAGGYATCAGRPRAVYEAPRQCVVRGQRRQRRPIAAIQWRRARNWVCV